MEAHAGDLERLQSIKKKLKQFALDDELATPPGEVEATTGEATPESLEDVAAETTTVPIIASPHVTAAAVELALVEKQLSEALTSLSITQDELHFSKKKLDRQQHREGELKNQILLLQKEIRERDVEAGLKGIQKFNFQKSLLLQRRSLLRMKKRQAQKLHTTLECQEAALMEAEDCAAQRRIFAEAHPHLAQKQQSNDRQDYGVNLKEKLTLYDYLQVNKTVVTSTHDEYIATKAAQSDFGGSLVRLKETVLSLMKQMKDNSDATLAGAERIMWPLVGKHPRPKDAFAKTARASMIKTKLLLAEGVKSLNTGISDMVSQEKSVKEAWVAAYLEGIAVKHEACQVEVDIGPSESERHLFEQLRDYQERHTELRDTFNKTKKQLSWERDRALLNLRFLQEKVIDLHRGMYTALHLVFKHRYKWIDRHVDSLKVFLKSKAAKSHQNVQFNLSLGEVVDKDLEQLRRFGDYFTRDDFFGINMTCKDAPSMSPTASGATGVSWKAGGKRKESFSKRLSLPTASAASLRRASLSHAQEERDAQQDTPTQPPPTHFGEVVEERDIPPSSSPSLPEAGCSLVESTRRTPSPLERRPSTPQEELRLDGTSDYTFPKQSARLRPGSPQHSPAPPPGEQTSPRNAPRSTVVGLSRAASAASISLSQVVSSKARRRATLAQQQEIRPHASPLPTVAVPAGGGGGGGVGSGGVHSSSSASRMRPSEHVLGKRAKSGGWISTPKSVLVVNSNGTHSTRAV